MRKLFTPQDIIAIVFCSTHKSLTLGKKKKYVFTLLKTVIFRYSYFTYYVSWLFAFKPNYVTIVSIPSNTNNTRWIDGVSIKRLGPHAKNKKAPNLI